MANSDPPGPGEVIAKRLASPHWLRAVFEQGKAVEDGARHFQFAIQMEPRDPEIYHEFALVLASAALGTLHHQILHSF